MSMKHELVRWDAPAEAAMPAEVRAVPEIVSYARQLSARERRQVVSGFEAGSFEMVTTFVWSKAMAALKRDLGALGMQLLGEMLNRPDLSDDDDVVDSITDREAVRLAEELGVVSSTEAMRLRQAHETIAHFSTLDSLEGEAA